MITVVSEQMIHRVQRELSEIQIRAHGDEIRSAFNLSVARAEREKLHGFQRGDSAILVDACNIIGEMSRLKSNEAIFLSWLDTVLDENKDIVGRLRTSFGIDEDDNSAEETPASDEIREKLRAYRAELARAELQLSQDGS